MSNEFVISEFPTPAALLDSSLNVNAASESFLELVSSERSRLPCRLEQLLRNAHLEAGSLTRKLESLFHSDRPDKAFQVRIDQAEPTPRSLTFLGSRVGSDDGAERYAIVTLEVEDVSRKSHASLLQQNVGLEEVVAERTRQLATSNLALHTANEELEAFCYSISHDLRAPLRAIDGFSQALLESYREELDQTGVHYLNRVRAGVQRIGHLIDDLLKLSKVSRSEMTFRKVDLSGVAEEIVSELKLIDPERKIEVEIMSGLNARCDQRLLRIALQNLLENAWKFTTKKDIGKITFGQTKRNDGLEFFIHDNGAGFDPELSERLFGPFQRLHSEKDFPGTGIGLATVRRIIKRHGGEVSGESQPGRGATFYFTLPMWEKNGDESTNPPR